MRITNVSATVLVDDHLNRDWVIVRVFTDEGVTGIGEAASRGGGVDQQVLRLGRLIVGDDPFDAHRLLQKMTRRLMLAGGTIQAASGIEIALLDVAAKALDTPLHTLLGGTFRERVPVYGDCRPAGEAVGSTLSAIAEESHWAVEQGFTAIKFDADPYAPEHMGDPASRHLSRAGIVHLTSVAATVRDAIGDTAEFGLDFHWTLSAPDAVRLLNALEPYDLAFAEDPFPPGSIDSLRRLREATSVPILAGELTCGLQGFRRLLAAEAVDIVAPDLLYTGGIRETQRIASLADTYDVPLAPHNVHGPIGCVASVHLCAAIPNCRYLEIHTHRAPWYDAVLGLEAPLVDRGFIEVPTGPGLGVELHLEEIEKHLKSEERFCE